MIHIWSVKNNPPPEKKQKKTHWTIQKQRGEIHKSKIVVHVL